MAPTSLSLSSGPGYNVPIAASAYLIYWLATRSDIRRSLGLGARAGLGLAEVLEEPGSDFGGERTRDRDPTPKHDYDGQSLVILT